MFLFYFYLSRIVSQQHTLVASTAHHRHQQQPNVLMMFAQSITTVCRHVTAITVKSIRRIMFKRAR